MSVETSDINDGTILAKTKQRTQGQNVQFTYELPSGRVVNSEWISPENKKRALMNWLETIRPMIVDDIQALQAAKRKAADEARAAQPKPSPSMPADVVEALKEVAARPQAPAPAAVDPAQYAKEQMTLTGYEVEALTQQLEQITGELSAVKASHKKWTLIYNALSGTEN
jgi:hypothetical protein